MQGEEGCSKKPITQVKPSCPVYSSQKGNYRLLFHTGEVGGSGLGMMVFGGVPALRINLLQQPPIGSDQQLHFERQPKWLQHKVDVVYASCSYLMRYRWLCVFCFYFIFLKKNIFRVVLSHQASFGLRRFRNARNHEPLKVIMKGRLPYPGQTGARERRTHSFVVSPRQEEAANPEPSSLLPPHPTFPRK